MNLVRRWRSLPFFWQAYWTTVLLLSCIVTLVEMSEDYLESVLAAYSGQPAAWHEALVWVVGILGPSLLSGYLLSLLLSRRMENIANTATQLSRGDLSARAEVTGDPDDVFGRMTGSFNSMAQSLERLLTNERRLLADISHELRSPLTRMHMAVALAQRNENAVTAPLIARMEKETTRMAEMVTLLLQQGRESLSPEGQTEQIDMADLLRDIAADFNFEGQDAEKKADCIVAGPLPIWGNALQLRTMLGSVAANALAYTPPGTAIIIRGLRNGLQAVVTIRDAGPGVPPDAVEDIFRAFYRVDDSRARGTGGVGLGLAIARQVARAHGGDIEAYNANPGLAVVIRLPLHNEQ